MKFLQAIWLGLELGQATVAVLRFLEMCL